jgi:sulfur carrier protein ThiS
LNKHNNKGNKKTRPQVTVHVKLSDFLARLVPETKLELKIDEGSTVEEFITFLTERFGDEFCRALVDRNGKLHADIAIVLNNKFIPPQQITAHTIVQKSNLSIIPIAGGG